MCLGAAMLSSIISVLVLLCYCCHKSQKQRPSEYVDNWRLNTGLNNYEVFMVPAASLRCGLAAVDSGADNRSSRPGTRGPPPAYESLNLNPSLLNPYSEKFASLPVMKKQLCGQASIDSELEKNWINDEDLPTYEVALKFESEKKP